MKVNGFQIEEHGSGYALTIRAHVGREEIMPGWMEEVLRPVLSKEGGLNALISPEQTDSGSTDSGPAETGDDDGAADTGRRRRGRRNAVGGTGDVPAGGEAGSPDTADAKPAGASKGRARRRSQPKAETVEAPAGRVKTRRRGKKEEKPAANPTGAASAAGRRSKKTKPPGVKAAKTKKSPSEEVSDEDLTKSASQAAADIGPPAVMDILDEFGVGEVRDLTQEQRREFVDRLTEARESAD